MNAPALQTTKKTAIIHRMVMVRHTCPFGLKAKDLLERQGFTVEDHWLRTREETDAFKAEHGVATTPQVFIDGQRIGGYDATREYFGIRVPKKDETSYTPVMALFAAALLLSLALNWRAFGVLLPIPVLEWFIGISMVLLGMLKLQDVESFSSMFLNYDLLAKRWVRYAYMYPYLEVLAGVLMVAGVLHWLSVPVALFIGGVGAVSVFKAVYLDKRELKCACVGGGTNVPLGFVSLLENVMMVLMALWMGAQAVAML